MRRYIIFDKYVWPLMSLPIIVALIITIVMPFSTRPPLSEDISTTQPATQPTTLPQTNSE